MEKSYILSLSLPLTSAIFCVTFFCLWLTQKTQRYILDWSLSFACGLIGATVGLARLFLDEAAWFSFLGNGFLVAMAFFACRGLMLRHTGRSADHLLLPILICSVLAGLWFGFIQPSIFGRGTATSLGAAALFAITANTVLKSEDRDRVSWLTAITFIISAIMLIGRPIIVFFVEGTVSSEAAVTGSWWGVSFRFLAMLNFVSMAILFLHRIATDLMHELKVQARTDHLTGVLNRGGVFSYLETVELENTFAVIICDIDEFKQVNDTYGHKVGDEVICNLANVVAQAAHSHNYIVGRLGGDEFVAVLPGADIVEARVFAEKICAAFADTPHHGIASSTPVTISVGVAVAIGGKSVDSALEHADAALYRAKLRGRNCVEVAILSYPEPQSHFRPAYGSRSLA